MAGVTKAAPTKTAAFGRHHLRRFLSGGDRRSIAQSSRALALIRANPELVADVVALATDSDRLVSMRAIDVLEKLAHAHRTWVEPYKHVFVGPLADSDMWEVRLQVVRTLPLFTWRTSAYRRAVRILRRDASHPRLFVRAWAVDSLARMADHDPSLTYTVQRHLRKFEHSGSSALVARARQIRARGSR
jgi:HEAT repeat protein